ncbi:insulin gene enhancer protein ISL-2A-like [Periophthalmus magnuspinnatus]|uniref:insulin gene enhancer protein ISL-2A-like n=1 Tax=Periophthalmus magnuspinnatus TaxID=409849 RepID=UPI002437427A|nr:insulin gene enhancer protein ISL-2A-like [Periophthalmus magnuspinnatus]
MEDYPKHSSRLTLCVGCGSQILDPYILRVSPDLEWHASCLRCAECGQYLDETCTCFVRDGRTFCRRDYARLFGIKCAKCNGRIRSDALVLRARGDVYHVECFRCSVCGRLPLPGDEVTVRGEELLCPEHEAPEEESSVQVRHTPVHHTRSSSEKSTRVRTVLNEKQLHTLRTCYNANPRPDALMKEQLVEMTGLSPRVIRVWFQNKRCKDKKRSLVLRQEESLQGLTATLLTVSSPVHHLQSPEAELLDVETQRPVWTSFNHTTLQPHVLQVLDSQSSSSCSDVSLSDTQSSLVLSPGDT